MSVVMITGCSLPGPSLDGPWAYGRLRDIGVS